MQSYSAQYNAVECRAMYWDLRFLQIFVLSTSPFLFIPDDELSSKRCVNSKSQYIVVFFNNLLFYYRVPPDKTEISSSSIEVTINTGGLPWVRFRIAIDSGQWFFDAHQKLQAFSDATGIPCYSVWYLQVRMLWNPPRNASRIRIKISALSLRNARQLFSSFTNE